MGTTLVPWALEGVDLGQSALEIGPGPGASTAVVRPRVRTLTCLERDPRVAAELAQRFEGDNVVVRSGDATAMTFAGGTFDSVVSLTMLHHVPTPGLQDRLFREVARVLKPGGIFVGADTLASLPLRLFHLFDTFEPVRPETLPERLARAGFVQIHVETGSRAFRFRARRKTPALRTQSSGISSEILA